MEKKNFDSDKSLEHISKESNKNKVFIENILSIIFGICKDDKNFSIIKEVEKLDLEINSLKENISKQTKLNNEGFFTEKELSQKVASLQSINSNLRVKLIGILK